MKLPFATVLAVGWLCAAIPANVSAPSAEDVHKLYGEPTMERFPVGNGITVTVEYGPDRAACQILIAARRLLVEAESPDSPMPSPGVSRVLQELLPPATRGKQLDSESVQVDGNTLLRTDYETASIRRNQCWNDSDCFRSKPRLDAIGMPVCHAASFRSNCDS